VTDIPYRGLTNSQVSLDWQAHQQRRNALSRVRALFRLWRRRMHQRTELARLDERELHDIGVTRADVHREADKWFWQA